MTSADVRLSVGLRTEHQGFESVLETLVLTAITCDLAILYLQIVPLSYLLEA